MRQFQDKFVTESMGPNPHYENRRPDPRGEMKDACQEGGTQRRETWMPVEGSKFLYDDLYLSVYVFIIIS